MNSTEIVSADKKFLKGRKILLTSFSYASFGGAELNAVEVAEQLSEFGAIPYFFSYDINGPLASHINDKFHTTVMTDTVYYLAEDDKQESLKYSSLNIDEYDYIWVGGNTIPISIIKQINKAKRLPKFIFIHMSPLVAFPLDAPLFPEFEKRISSCILSVSEETTEDCIHRILGRDILLDRWYNPAPSEFRYIKKRNGELKNIAVISSSHPGEEVMCIKELLGRKGVSVEYIGKFNDNVQVVDAGFYDKYDMVIGIGKNAKYSLVSGVPIYIYGRFGGGGYLNENNYNDNNRVNFSGRGSGRKVTDQIVDEIINGYQDALSFHENRRSEFIEEFSLDIATERLFRKLENIVPVAVSFSDSYINWLVSMQIIIMHRIQETANVRRLTEQRDQLELQVLLKSNETEGLYNSRTWRVTRPFRFISGKVRQVLLSLSKKFHKR